MIPRHVFSFRLLPQRFAICRLDAIAPAPEWPSGAFVSVTRTPQELSIVCEERSVPTGVQGAG